MKSKPLKLIVPLALVALAWGSTFQVEENQTVIVARLGDPSRVVSEAGLAFKLPPPFDTVTRVDRRVRIFESPLVEYLTQDKKNLLVGCFVAWNVADPLAFVQSARDTASAEARLGDIALAELGNLLGAHPFSDLVAVAGDAGGLDMQAFNQELTDNIAARAAADFGIAVEVARIERLNYPRENKQAVFRRMEAERKKIAQEIRSQGIEEAERIRADANREAAVLINAARREAEELRGQGEAEATRIYGQAYGADPEFFEFLRTLEAYEEVFGENSTIVVPEDADFLRVLGTYPGAAPATPASEEAPEQ